MEKLINKYVSTIIANPLINLYDHATEVFGESPLPQTESNLVVPELVELPTTKRRLVRDIVFQKTQHHIAATQDAFMENTVILVDKREV